MDQFDLDAWTRFTKGLRPKSEETPPEDKTWLIKKLEYFKQINERDAKIQKGELVELNPKKLVKPLAKVPLDHKFIIHVDKNGQYNFPKINYDSITTDFYS